MTRDELKKRIDAVEEGYEYFLAYAAQGLSGAADGAPETQIRDFLQRTDQALTGLAAGLNTLVEREELKPAEPFQSMIGALERDARTSQAAIQLVLAQPAISSQLIDNLNASIHLRALLTDLFLFDEILKG